MGVPAKYGHAHRQLRARWAPRVAAEDVLCGRCGLLILSGEAWDLGHDWADPERYDGPQHQACNRSTVAEKRLKRGSRRGWRWSNPAWR
jgi:hypothetical protein